jgi:multidrug efflux system membrane fusion protein
MRFRLLFVVLAVAAAGAIAWYVASGDPTEAALRRGQDIEAPIPVVAQRVVRRDFPVFLSGLGTVTAFNTVLVRSRVDGRIDSIAFEEGQDVAAGDVLARIDPRPFEAALHQVQALFKKDQAMLANARADLTRSAELAARQFASRQSLDTQRATVAQLEAAVEADQAQIDNARVQLDYTTITAPIAGRTGIRQIDAGNIIHANDPGGIVVLTELDPISVVFTLPEIHLAAVNRAIAHAGKAKLRVIAVSRDGETVLGDGSLALVDNLIDQGTATMKLKAVFANPERKLWPGQFVTARLALETRPSVAVVPAPAVQRGPDGTYAFVVKLDRTVEMRPLSVGPGDGGTVVIEKGLAEGELVVTDGQYRLQPGSRVAVADGAAVR